jgi:hypothetical protein
MPFHLSIHSMCRYSTCWNHALRQHASNFTVEKTVSVYGCPCLLCLLRVAVFVFQEALCFLKVVALIPFCFHSRTLCFILTAFVSGWLALLLFLFTKRCSFLAHRRSRLTLLCTNNRLRHPPNRLCLRSSSCRCIIPLVQLAHTIVPVAQIAFTFRKINTSLLLLLFLSEQALFEIFILSASIYLLAWGRPLSKRTEVLMHTLCVVGAVSAFVGFWTKAEHAHDTGDSKYNQNVRLL